MNIEVIVKELKEGFRQIVREELDRTHRPPEPDMNPRRTPYQEAGR